MFGIVYKPKWTFIFIAICVVAFLFEQASDLFIYFVFIPSLAFEAPWIFVTSIFLHADLSHLFFNMLALFFFGRYLERLTGGRTFAMLFLISGIVGNIGYLITSGDPWTPALGASGAIYGVIGALAVITPFALVFIYGILPLPLIVVAGFWALADLVGLFAPSTVAHGAHLAGMFVGVVFGIYYRGRLRPVARYF